MQKIIHAGLAYINNKNFLKNAFIGIENGKIIKISDQELNSDNAEVIDLSGHMVLPGFTNAHCHLELTDIGPLEKNTYMKWAFDLMKNRPEDYDSFAAFQKGCDLLKNSGTTTVLDHISFFTKVPDKNNLPINIKFFGEVMGASKPRGLMSLEILRQKNVDFLTPHSVYALHPDILDYLCQNKENPFSIHIAESDDEKNYFQNKSGDLFDFINNMEETKHYKEFSGYAFLKKYNLDKTLFIHGNDFSNDELDHMATLKNNCIVHCPGSFEFFEHNGFPYQEIKNRNIPLALGTDSIASNTELNMLTEIQRFLTTHPSTTFEELIPMITTNALEAIGIHNTGKISEDYQTDLIAFEIQNQDPLAILKSRSSVDFLMTSKEEQA